MSLVMGGISITVLHHPLLIKIVACGIVSSIVFLVFSCIKK